MVFLKEAAKLIASIIIGLVIAAAGLFFAQKSFIYMPASFNQETYSRMPPEVKRIAFQTSQGRQTAYYVPAPHTAGNDTPRSLWFVFSGQGGNAILNYLSLKPELPDPSAAYFLLDYPGYNECEGSPSVQAINESSREAFLTLAQYLHLTPKELEKRTTALGLSLGTGAALEFARNRELPRAVLFFPYVSLRSMACHRVGRPVCWLLTENFDNMKALAELEQRMPPPKILIVHGTADEVIPVSQSRELASSRPKLIQYIEVTSGSHAFGDLVSRAPQIYSAMRKP